MESPATTSQSASPEQMMDVEVKEEPDELQDFYFDADGSLLPKEETDPIYGDYQNPNDTADIDDKDDLDLDDDKKSDLDLDEDRKSDLDLDDNKKSDQDPSEQEIDTKKASLPAGLCVIETKEDTINNILMANVVKTKIFLAKGTLFGPFPDLNPSASVKPSADSSNGSKDGKPERERNVSKVDIVRVRGKVYYKILEDIHPQKDTVKPNSTVSGSDKTAIHKPSSDPLTTHQRTDKTENRQSLPTSLTKKFKPIHHSKYPHLKLALSSSNALAQSCSTNESVNPQLASMSAHLHPGNDMPHLNQEIPLSTQSKPNNSSWNLIDELNLRMQTPVSSLSEVPVESPVVGAALTEPPLPETSPTVDHPADHSDSESRSSDELSSNVSQQNYTEVACSEDKTQKYECSKCMEIFSSEDSLDIHSRKHGQPPAECENASNDITTNPQNETSLICDICDKIYKTIASLKRHKKESHTGNIQHSCWICETTFKSRSALTKHKILHYGKPRAYKKSSPTPQKIHNCPHCDEFFERIHDLRVHVVRHTGVQPFQCPHCGKGFLHKYIMNAHMLIHNKRHKCSDCDKRFPNSRQLQLHSQIHTEEGRKTLPKNRLCPECGKWFDYKAIKRHSLTHQTHDKKHVCSQCDKAFVRKSCLHRHEKRHKGLHPATLMCSCPDCGKLMCRGSLKDHRDRFHVQHDTEPHQCPLCNKLFSIGRDLQKHMDTHDQSKTYPCNECGKIYHTKRNLKRHQRSHSADPSEIKTRHLCAECGKSFANKSYLKYHRVTHKRQKPKEDKPKPFKCDECLMAFSSKASLQYHKLTHTGDKPHQCPDCGRSFSLLGNLKRHQMSHTDERPHKCTECDASFRAKISLLSHIEDHANSKS